MFHVSFRYIFGIPPLILVLLPVASSDCEIEGKSGEEYQHVIMVSLNDLDRIRENDSNCLNNEPNFFKKHSCDDDKDKEKKQPSLGEVQPTKNLEEKKSSKGQKKQDEMCFLMILLEKIKTCWNKILSGTKEH
ncbi:interleukin-7 isoform X3 [Myotis yumanensis]|uniref:interleukin-7 isoform X3 n=1 Tax=Eptesicus fuscus TaxID=29078 RepID=UPI001019EE13|nr:interleukin-7 isoform X3 [Eptesicus fuscus]XP_036194650.1 interleukin-7 isoform X5 [Myotis myotis]XP_059528659.1 interleukin-7 isoform X3 [Myotis daubentonii]